MKYSDNPVFASAKNGVKMRNSLVRMRNYAIIFKEFINILPNSAIAGPKPG
jgi:hypothetical protein